MKKALIIFSFLFLIFTSNSLGQKNVEPQIQVDPILEADARHNLEVAWQYYKLKKAYKAALLRFEETFAAHPDFSRMDEFLYIAAMSSVYLADGKGKQELILKNDEEKKRFSPERLRADAVVYFTLIKDKYPKSKHFAEAEKKLKTLPEKK